MQMVQFFSLHQHVYSRPLLTVSTGETRCIYLWIYLGCIGELCDSLFDNWFMYQELLTSINHHNAKKKEGQFDWHDQFDKTLRQTLTSQLVFIAYFMPFSVKFELLFFYYEHNHAEGIKA